VDKFQEIVTDSDIPSSETFRNILKYVRFQKAVIFILKCGVLRSWFYKKDHETEKNFHQHSQRVHPTKTCFSDIFDTRKN